MYRTESLFSYADGYYAIFPPGQENRKVGKGSVVIEDDYIVYFNPETPEEIKNRFIKDYAEYYAKEKASGKFF